MMIFAYNLELSSAKYMYSDILTIIRGGSGGGGGGGGGGGAPLKLEKI
jgi:hypothetical protein